MRRIAAALFVALAIASCVHSEWILKDPPNACASMCQGWGMELAAVVGVGKQDQTKAEGATACVCKPRSAAPTSGPATAQLTDAEYQAAGYAAIPPEIANREAAARQQQQQSSSSHH